MTEQAKGTRNIARFQHFNGLWVAGFSEGNDIDTGFLVRPIASAPIVRG